MNRLQSYERVLPLLNMKTWFQQRLSSVYGSLCMVSLVVGMCVSTTSTAQLASGDTPSISNSLDWQSLPDLPDALGVAGPFAGVTGDALLVAGGAHFPHPVWDNSKQWSDRVFVLTRSGEAYAWTETSTLPRPIGYGASITIPEGVLCMGGNDADQTFDDVYLLSWNPSTKELSMEDFPSLPTPCAFGQAALIGKTIYLAGGQQGASLESAMNNFWSLNLENRDDPELFKWKQLPAWPGTGRAFNLTLAQHNGYHDCIYVLSGRRQQGDQVEFLKDVWEFTPGTSQWRPRSDVPRCVMAAPGVSIGQSHLFVFGGADGSLFFKADELKDEHPGFPKESFAYHTITDTWTLLGTSPANHVTTTAVKWRDRIVIPSGEVRPRIRSPKIWSVEVIKQQRAFGWINYTVLVVYLLAMACMGLVFAKRNKNTNDYFRGGKQVPWWAAGCSIFATMLSSLTYTGVPSKSYAQDWVYAIGNMMIPVVAFFAVFVALPFYRQLDITSAYEYLEKRFSRGVRLFGSASFTLFHLFRMAVVMSLTGLALAIATPLTPAQSVLCMGALSIFYCTMGGIEAVIWTDTIQTFVLLGGAMLAGLYLIHGTDGGFTGMTQAALDADKFRLAHFHWDISSAQIALWIIILGGIGQNISSYTADQAVVQRYMTTPDQKRAARSIWTNAVMSTVATILFFGIGTALFGYYRSHPEKLDPTISTDQIFPLFISNEMATGLAGLIVAGIFSAAQSTVSTSMNSTATTLITDFVRPLGTCRDDKSDLKMARWLTLLMGVIGTLLALFFVDPTIRSLFDAFIKVIGLFMGVLGGLFVLGVLTQRANAIGAMAGAWVGAATMFGLWKLTQVNGYLYTTCGITTCFVVGYLVSLMTGSNQKDLSGLTIFTRAQCTPSTPSDA